MEKLPLRHSESDVHFDSQPDAGVFQRIAATRVLLCDGVQFADLETTFRQQPQQDQNQSGSCGSFGSVSGNT